MYPYHTIVQVIFHILWGNLVHCGIFQSGVLLKYTLEGVSNVANFDTAYKECQENQDSSFLLSSLFFVSKSNIF